MKSLNRIFLVFLVCTLVSCDPTDDINDQEPTESYFFTGLINGEKRTIEPGNDRLFSGTAIKIDSANYCERTYTSILTETNGVDNESVKFVFHKAIRINESCTEKQIMELYPQSFPNKEYLFARDDLFIDATNIEVVFRDRNNRIWSSRVGTQSTLSYFEVTSSMLVSDIFSFGKETLNVEGMFSCEVYNSSGEFITIREGSFSYVFFN